MRSRLGTIGVAVLGLGGASCQSQYESPFSVPAAAPLPSAATLIYVSNGYDGARANAPRELFAIDDRGGPPSRLTTCASRVPACEVVEAAPAPDGNRVAMRRRVDADRDSIVEPDEDDGIYVVDLMRGIEGRTISTKQTSGLDWSPLDDILVYSALGEGGLEDLYSAFANGAEDGNRTSTADVRERRFRFDPLGRTLVYERSAPSQRSEVWLYRNLVLQLRLTNNSAVDLPSTLLPGTHYMLGSDADPDYSPDGTAVVFRRLTGPGQAGRGAWELMTVNTANGGDLRSLTPGPAAYRSAPDWGPKGIAFVEIPVDGSTAQLVVLDPAVGGGRRVVHTQTSSFAMDAPRWIP